MSNDYLISPVFCLMGPTAVGKTALAYELANNLPVEIISVDSAMVYREMDLGTAKPSKAELATIPQHLINILDPVDSYSAAQFCLDTQVLIKAIYQRHKIPLLVGGAMMYFYALQNGLAKLPATNQSIRIKIIRQAELYGWPVLHQNLAMIDPEAAAKIHQHDHLRIQRALEIYYLTGKAPTSCWSTKQLIGNYQFINFILLPAERSWLHMRIAQRFAKMLTAGLIDEVEYLMIKWRLSVNSPAMRSVGYSQIIAYLAGHDNYATMQAKVEAATRQLAKRQLTWLRRNWQDAQYFISEHPNLNERLSTIMKKIMHRAVPSKSPGQY